MSETLYYCKNCDCEISECPYNLEHLDPRTFGKCKVVHLEDTARNLTGMAIK